MSENHLPLFTYLPQPDSIFLFFLNHLPLHSVGGYFSDEIIFSISFKKAKEESYGIHYLRERMFRGKIKKKFLKVAPCAYKSVLKKKLVIVTENITPDVCLAGKHL